MNAFQLLTAAATLTLAAAGALAQPTVTASAPTSGPGRGPGAATGPGMGPGMSPGPMGPRPGMGPGGGMRPGHARGPGGRAGADNTWGWLMMTPQEREEHHAKMQTMGSRTECDAYMEQHRRQMAERAKERGVMPPARPRRQACAGLKP